MRSDICFIVVAVALMSCGENIPAVQQVKTESRADSSRYVNMSMTLEIPTSRSKADAAIAQEIVDMAAFDYVV